MTKDTNTFLTSERCETIVKYAINFASILWAAAIASEFFAKTTSLIRAGLIGLIVWLILIGIIFSKKGNK